MSFQSISCTNCSLYFSNIPQSGFIDENGKPRILMFPNGNKALHPEVLARLSDNFFQENEFWVLEEYLCLSCFTKSELILGEDRLCLQCKSKELKNSTEILNQKCPVCGIGHIQLNPPSGMVF